jgi:hypothetical protein
VAAGWSSGGWRPVTRRCYRASERLAYLLTEGCDGDGDGALAAAEALVGPARGDEPQHLQLAAGQRLDQARRRASSPRRRGACLLTIFILARAG